MLLLLLLLLCCGVLFVCFPPSFAAMTCHSLSCICGDHLLLRLGALLPLLTLLGLLFTPGVVALAHCCHAGVVQNLLGASGVGGWGWRHPGREGLQPHAPAVGVCSTGRAARKS